MASAPCCALTIAMGEPLRRCFLGRLFLLQRIECLLRLLHLRIDNGCGVGIVAACNLVECVKGCLPFVGFFSNMASPVSSLRGTRSSAVGWRLASSSPALLILLQHLLVMLLHLLNLLLWKCNATIALRGLVESTLGVLLQLLVCHGLLHVLALILYRFSGVSCTRSSEFGTLSSLPVPPSTASCSA